MAKQPEDLYTLELTLPRGRGRPRLENALTPAERAQRYRNRKAAAKKRAANMPAIKYRGPNGEAWTGRGLAPRWITAWCKNLECDRSAFLVQA